MSRFTDALVVSPMADGNTWIVMRPFGYDIGEEGSGDTVEVEIGFTTDFASIPRIFWAVLPRWGKYGNATVIHDWLYWVQNRERDEADFIMLEAMGVLEVPGWQKFVIYWAVRLIGWVAWIRNQWDREAGFDRVVSRDDVKATDHAERPGLMRRTWRHYVSDA
ncbi:MAG TPA: DUF1353 domain-containing protein [Gammaproteobacteria bacterium]